MNFFLVFFLKKKIHTHPITTIVKSRKFHPLRKYAPGCMTNPYAIIFMTHSTVNITKNTYSIFSKYMLVVFESPFGKGVYTAKATQFAKIVSRIKYSNGLVAVKENFATQNDQNPLHPGIDPIRHFSGRVVMVIVK